MKAPLSIRVLKPEEQDQIEAGLRPSDAFTLRRSQILLESNRKHRPSKIAQNLGCATQTVRNAIHAFEEKGIACLTQEPSRPKTAQAQFDQAKCEALRALLHQSPRTLGKMTSCWTLALAAEMCFERGLTRGQVSIETIRLLAAPGAASHPTFRPGKPFFYHFRRLRLKGIWSRLFTALRGAERERVGKNAQPSAAIMDAQSVKTVEESASISGYAAHKHVKGSKRHILVDTLGLPLSIYVTPADVRDTRGARCLLAGLAPLVPRLKKIWADGVYRGQELADWCKVEGNWDLEVVAHAPGVRGFSIQPRRWEVERTFGWLSRSRRLSRDYERKVQTSETLIQVAMFDSWSLAWAEAPRPFLIRTERSVKLEILFSATGIFAV